MRQILPTTAWPDVGLWLGLPGLSSSSSSVGSGLTCFCELQHATFHTVHQLTSEAIPHINSCCVSLLLLVWLEVAAAAGVPVLLDAGGVDAPLSDALLQHISTISPNETELQRLTGQQTETEQQVLAAATALQQHAAQLPKPPGGVSTAAAGQQLASGTSGAQQGFSGDQRLLRVLVKRGSSGSMMVAPDGGQEAMQTAVAAKRVVDTTGRPADTSSMQSMLASMHRAHMCAGRLSGFDVLGSKHTAA